MYESMFYNRQANEQILLQPSVHQMDAVGASLWGHSMEKVPFRTLKATGHQIQPYLCNTFHKEDNPKCLTPQQKHKNLE